MNPTLLSETQLKQRRNKRLLALAGVVVLSAAAIGAYWSLHGGHFIATNNAYAAAEVAQITPTVGGTVLEVKVHDTQLVKRGDVLVLLDPTDIRLAVAQAEAELDRTLRRVRSYVANDGNLASQVAAAQADFERARVDLQRREVLTASGSVSGDELTRAKNAHAASEARLAAARSAQAANAALIKGVSVENNPEVLAARARLEQTRVDLQRTVIRAPMNGVIAKRQVQLGQRVAPGAPLMTLVPVDQMYADANFKEVQLSKVRVGQRVILHADLYGEDVIYHGVVEGFSGGSGAAFSAIPAQNATGNWIKVVQRLPVRIRLDPAELQAHPLRVGLSMSAEIDTRTAVR